MPSKRKCQKRKNQNSLVFLDQCLYYTNPKNLAYKYLFNPKATMRPSTILRKEKEALEASKTLINDPGRRLIWAHTGEVDVIDIKKNTRRELGLLLRDFGVKRVYNDTLINGGTIKTKMVDIVKAFKHHGLSQDDIVTNINVKLKLFINFDSPAHSDFKDILTTNGKEKLKNLLQTLGIVDTRSFEDYYKIQHFFKIDEDIDLSKINGLSFVERDSIFSYTGEVKNLLKEIMWEIENYIGGTNMHIIYYEFIIRSTFQNKILNFKDGIIRDKLNEYELTEWANIEYGTFNNDGDSCAVSFISQKFPKLYWDIKKYETDNGIVVDKFLKFCDRKFIGYNIYNELGNKLYENEGKIGTLCCLFYNNHIFPINGGKPLRYSSKELQIKILNESCSLKKFKYFLDMKVLPSNIKVNEIISNNKISIKNEIIPDKRKQIEETSLTPFIGKNVKYTYKYELDKCDEIIPNKKKENKQPSKTNEIIQCKKNETEPSLTSFVVKNIKYIFNDQWKRCNEILKKLKFEKYIYDGIKIIDIPILLEKILRINKLPESFFPRKFKIAPLYYTKKIDTEDKNKMRKIIFPKIDKTREFHTIDKNKAYAYALYCLQYLLYHDWRKHNTIKIEITHLDVNIIRNKFLYVVRPEQFSIALPHTGLYPGYYLKEISSIMSGTLKYDILEEIETEAMPNYYKKIIKLMIRTMTNDEFKKAMVILIGKMERDMNEKYSYKYLTTCNEESSKMFEGFTHKLGDHTLFFKESIKIKNVRCKLPINIQIKHMSRLLLLKKIRELKIADKDIIQINTDSITYYGKLPDNLDKNCFEGWKESEYKSIGNNSCFDFDRGIEIINNIPTPISLVNIEGNSKLDQIRILHNKYAGSGKTTYIIEKLIPKLEKEKTSYIIICPTHDTLSEYKRKNLNCSLYHNYTCSNTIPKEDYIIFDEIGCVKICCHDLLFKLYKNSKNYECFGDFKQLLPPKESRASDQEHYLKYMFDKIDNKFVNYRNNFTKKYYDDLFNEEIDIVKEVNKWSSPIDEAEVIICYRTEKASKNNKTREKYNNKMLKKLNMSSDDIGVKLICISNDLVDNDIYNHQRFIINKRNESNEGIKYKLKDINTKEIYEITEKQMKKFRPAYCINVYECQGRNLKSYHWAKEDNRFLNGRMAYTIISRLIQEKN